MRSFDISNCVTAREAMLSTTLPSFAAPGGTRTAGVVASTRMYGVRPLSLIHSSSARKRYGRFELIAAGVVMDGAPRGQCGVGGGFAESRSEELLFGRQAARESLASEDALAVIGDVVRFFRNLHAERIEAPD